MSTPSPGPGLRLASDGNRYPQRWEYNYIAYNCTGDNLDLLELQQKADAAGQRGWEMINFTAVRYDQGGANIYNLHPQSRTWSVVCLMKRPLQSV